MYSRLTPCNDVEPVRQSRNIQLLCTLLGVGAIFSSQLLVHIPSLCHIRARTYLPFVRPLSEVPRLHVTVKYFQFEYVHVPTLTSTHITRVV